MGGGEGLVLVRTTASAIASMTLTSMDSISASALPIVSRIRASRAAPLSRSSMSRSSSSGVVRTAARIRDVTPCCAVGNGEGGERVEGRVEGGGVTPNDRETGACSPGVTAGGESPPSRGAIGEQGREGAWGREGVWGGEGEGSATQACIHGHPPSLKVGALIHLR